MIIQRDKSALIKDVKSILILPMQSDERMPVYQQIISIRTAKDETFELLLQAPKKRNLAFRKPPKSHWREPLIYIPDEDIPY
jgi:hypothetical protein